MSVAASGFMGRAVESLLMEITSVFMAEVMSEPRGRAA